MGDAKDRKEITHEEWTAEARGLFGDDAMSWAFECPACGHVATVGDWKKAGAPDTAAAFSCVGRWLTEKRDAFTGNGPGPCNYAGGGLFGLNPVRVMYDGEPHDVFAFPTPTD